MKLPIRSLAVFASFLLSASAHAGVVWLDALETNQEIQPWGQPQRNLSIQRTPLIIAGKHFSAGLGIQSPSRFWIALGRGADAFKAQVGVDDAGGSETADFIVAIDGQTVWKSGPMHRGDSAKPIDLDVKGKSYLVLAVDGNEKADWVDAHFDTAWSDPIQAEAERADPYILTPASPAAPRLNNAPRYGARPGREIHYTIPCTGTRPIHFGAKGLPQGVLLDQTRGWLTGQVATAGEYNITLTATNAEGSSTRPLTLAISDKLSLTPPMGWSSWNVWCAEPTQARALAAADAMVKFDLINHGFTYVNIDDGWQGDRGGKFNGIQPNEKFPNIHQLIEQVHSMGLKFGVYSGPWICSYCGYTGGSSDNTTGAWNTALRNLPESGHTMGKYNLADADAKEWASWGVDYLKYDWYPNKEPEIAAMSNALRDSGRDIIYSISNSASLSMAPTLVKYSQLWRASGDIRDTWPSISLNGFGHGDWAKVTQPGAWPDPDMLVIGQVGFGQEGWGQITRSSKLTPDEQYTHVTLWSLLAAPLILGCDLQKLDPFTLNLITNDEVIGVDQDPLGKAATKVAGDYFHEVWARPQQDGSLAVGLFNLCPGKMKFTLTPQDLKLTGSHTARDLWRQKDLGELENRIDAELNGHGVLLLKIK